MYGQALAGGGAVDASVIEGLTSAGATQAPRRLSIKKSTSGEVGAPCLGSEYVNVNELRLGFSNTTRNPEGILSHSNRKSCVTTTDPCVVHAPSGHLAPTLSHSLKKTELKIHAYAKSRGNTVAT